MGNCHHCWVSHVLMYVVWWAIASGLLTLTWNKVVAAFSKVKQAKYWQAALLIFTLMVLRPPCRMGWMHGDWHGGCCNHMSCCHNGEDGDEKCPYMAGEHEGGKHEVAPPKASKAK